MISARPKKVSEELTDKLRNWLNHSGWNNLFSDSLQPTTSKSSYWLPVKLITTPQTVRVGIFSNVAEAVYARTFDLPALFHELQHADFFKKVVKDTVNPRNYDPAFVNTLDEALAFTFEAMVFGNQGVVYNYLGQNKVYSHQQADLAHFMLQNYFVGGRYFAPELKKVALEFANTSQKRNLTLEDYCLHTERTIQNTVKTVQSRSSQARETTVEQQIKRYFTEGFCLPPAVAQYILAKNQYSTLEEAVEDIGTIKVGTINAFKRIQSGLYLFGQLNLKEAEAKAIEIIQSDQHLLLADGLGEFEQAISLAYEVGGVKLVAEVARRAFTDPLQAEYFSQHLPQVFTTVQEVTPTARIKFLERWSKDEQFRRSLDKFGHALISGYFRAHPNDPLATGKFLETLVTLNLPEVATTKEVNSYRLGCNQEELYSYLRLTTDISETDKLTILPFLPQLSALGEALLVLPSYEMKGAAFILGVNNESSYRDFADIIFEKEESLIPRLYRQAKAKPGKLADNFANEVAQACIQFNNYAARVKQTRANLGGHSPLEVLNTGIKKLREQEGSLDFVDKHRLRTLIYEGLRNDYCGSHNAFLALSESYRFGFNLQSWILLLSQIVRVQPSFTMSYYPNPWKELASYLNACRSPENQIFAEYCHLRAEGKAAPQQQQEYVQKLETAVKEQYSQKQYSNCLDLCEQLLVLGNNETARLYAGASAESLGHPQIALYHYSRGASQQNKERAERMKSGRK